MGVSAHVRKHRHFEVMVLQDGTAVGSHYVLPSNNDSKCDLEFSLQHEDIAGLGRV